MSPAFFRSVDARRRARHLLATTTIAIASIASSGCAVEMDMESDVDFAEFEDLELDPVAAAGEEALPDDIDGDLEDPQAFAYQRCPAYTPPPRDSKVDFDTRIDGSEFVDTFRSTVGDKGMGYVVVLQNDRRRNVATATGGWAISPCDPEGGQPWTVDTASKIGSVSKLITTAAALNASENQHFRIEGSIESAMPRRWSLHPTLSGLKWSELLGHRAGFRKSSGVSQRERLAQRFDNDPVRGARKYSNALGIAGVLLYGAIADSTLDRFDNVYAHVSIEKHDEEFNRLAQNHYIRWSKREVLDPSGAYHASCRLQDAKDAGRPFARSYTDKSDRYGDMGKDNSLNCPSGGWQMSARGLMRFIRTLRHTDRIITDISYDSMTSMFRDINGRSTPYLGFDGRDGGYQGGFSFDKNGSIQNYKTYVAMLPHGYTLVAMSNSSDLSAGLLESAAKAAWNAAYK